MRSSDLDPLDRLFYPGGVPPKAEQERRRNKEPEQQLPNNNWDANPKLIPVKGEEKEFFRVSALAMALGKSVKTIYAWETQGRIPMARYRSAVKRDALKDKAAKGDRLYTRQQIEAALSAAKKTGVISGKRTNWKQFTALVSEAWSK